MLVSFVLMIVGMVGIVMGGIKYSEWLLNRSIGTWHSQADEILLSGKPPAQWLREYRRAHWWVHNSDQVERALQIYSINRLTRLIQYFEKSQLLADDESREALIGQLSDIQLAWNEQRLHAQS